MAVAYIHLCEEASSSSKDLHEIYRMWCEENSLIPLKSRSFSDCMVANADKCYTDIIFPSLDVRFIAINDGVDSEKGDSDGFSAIRNLFNEWYLRDTSKKIRAVFRQKGTSGKHIGNPVFGYFLLRNQSSTSNRKETEKRRDRVVTPLSWLIVTCGYLTNGGDCLFLLKNIQELSCRYNKRFHKKMLQVSSNEVSSTVLFIENHFVEGQVFQSSSLSLLASLISSLISSRLRS